jgi:hypothetical protein
MAKPGIGPSRKLFAKALHQARFADAAFTDNRNDLTVALAPIALVADSWSRSQINCPMDQLSHGSTVPWINCPMDQLSHGSTVK